MKAEQRKELETNALADRMGHFVQRVKTRPRNATIYWVLGCVVVVIAVFVIARWYQVSREENATRWFYLDTGSKRALDALRAPGDSETNPGKAARFQLAWLLYWEAGMKRLGVGNGSEAMESLDNAASLYKKLAEECEGDPIWEPEAMYGLAVIEETHAVQNLDALEGAKKLYENLAKKHKDSARGQLATEWLENYENKEKREQLQQFYIQMHASLGIVDPALQRQIDDFRRKHMLDLQKKKDKGK